MRKKLFTMLLALTVCVTAAAPSLAASDEMTKAADTLHALGLLQGVGTKADGTPDFDLDRAPSRAEAVTLLVRLLGKEAEAKATTWQIPFTDVAEWARPYVGYAYTNGLTNGISDSLFGSADLISTSQYLTFVLRALGYTSGEDFQWNRAWETTDSLQITDGRYDAQSAFTRGDAVLASSKALNTAVKNGSKTLLQSITEAQSAIPSNASDTPAGSADSGKIIKTYTCTGDASPWEGSAVWKQNFDSATARTKAKVEVYSPKEAVITIEAPFPLSEAWMYGVDFVKNDGKGSHGYHFSHQRYDDTFASAIQWSGEKKSYSLQESRLILDDFFNPSSEEIKGVTFSEQTEDVPKGLLSWRVKLPENASLNFEQLSDYTMNCSALAAYGGA